MNDKELLIKFGQQIREIRLNNNLTISEISIKSQLHQNYISKVELGKTNPTLIRALKITNVLNIKLSDILKEINN